jgi:hypothetical protein
VTVPDPATARRVVNYRRRKPLPAISLIVVLGLIATIVWIRTIESAERRTDTHCAAPQPVAVTGTPDTNADATTEAAKPPLGEVLTRDALDAVEPLPPDAVKVTVLNANGQRGQAALVSGVLTKDLGFGSAGEPANDPVYPAFDLDCVAQIRFGPAGLAAGRTLSLVVPCAELVRDERDNDTVDLALGHKFDGLRPTPEAKEALRRLTELATAKPTEPAGGQQAAPATVEPALLVAARAVHC